MEKSDITLGSKLIVQCTVFIFVLGMLGLGVPEKSQAQKVGAGLSFGDKLNMVGGQIGATYRFHQNFRIAGDVSVFIPKEFENSDNRWNWWSINVNGNFVPVETGRFRAYVLSGLNYATIRIKYPKEQGVNIGSGLGLNAGAGVEYSFSFGDVYTEGKYVFANERYQQISINAGVRFYLMPR